MERIKINDGSKSYEIVNQNDRVLGVFTFNPTDVNMVEKYNSIAGEIEASLKQANDGNEQTLIEVSKQIKEKISELIGGNTDMFFNITSPLSPLSNGQLFIENLMEAIGQIIETEMNVRVKKIRARMNKYTGNYK